MTETKEEYFARLDAVAKESGSGYVNYITVKDVVENAKALYSLQEAYRKELTTRLAAEKELRRLQTHITSQLA